VSAATLLTALRQDLRDDLSLVPNWRKVVRYGWSFRFAALSFVLSMLEVAFPYFDGVLPVGRGTFGLLAGLVTGASMASRLIAQTTVSGTPAAAPGGEA